MTQKKRKELMVLFLDAFDKTAGNVSVCCKQIGISRNCFYEWKKNFPEFREKVEEAEESLIDIVETKLMKNINEGKTAEIIFFLKTKAKHRGYVEVQENINHNNNAPEKSDDREELKRRLDNLRKRY